MRLTLDLAWAMRPYLGSRVGNAVFLWISDLAWAMRLTLDLAWAIRPYLGSRVDNAVLPWISDLASAVRYLPWISR